MKNIIFTGLILVFVFFNPRCFSLTIDEYLIIKARINGQPVSLAMDTGAETTILFHNAAQRLKLSVTQPPKDLMPTPGKVAMGLTEECSISFDGTEITRCQFKVVELPPEQSFVNFDGVIGWLNIRHNILTIDADSRQIGTLTGLPEDIHTWSKWQIAQVKDFLFLFFKIQQDGKHQGLVLVDTGSPCGVSLNTQRWNQWLVMQKDRPFTLNAIYTPAVGLKVYEERWADTLAIGDFKISNVPVLHGDILWEKVFPDYQATIGLFALTKFEIIIDGPEGYLYTQPKVRSKSVYSYNRAAAIFVPQDTQNDWMVAHVVRDGPAYKAGVRDGDQLLKIDDLDVTRWRTDPNVLPLYRFWAQPAGTRLKLPLMRQNTPFTCTVELKEIFPQDK